MALRSTYAPDDDVWTVTLDGDYWGSCADEHHAHLASALLNDGADPDTLIGVETPALERIVSERRLALSHDHGDGEGHTHVGGHLPHAHTAGHSGG